jgi:hypothetical protein
MKKGIVVLHVPVGSIKAGKIKKYLKKTLPKKAIKQIKKSNYIVLIFPSRTKTDLQIETLRLE